MSDNARRCVYCEPASEAYRIDARTGKETPCEVLLCTWAEYAPEAQDKLIDTPPWLQHNALAGHLMRPRDCETCPCFKAKGTPHAITRVPAA